MNWKSTSVLFAVSDLERALEMVEVIRQFEIKDVSLVGCTNDAISMMVKKTFNLIFTDARVPVTMKREAVLYGGIDYIRFVRMCKPPVCNATIVFLRCPVGSASLIETQDEMIAARDAGANCVLGHPLTADKMTQLVLPELNTSRAFLRTETYVGPCRRRSARAVPLERRQMFQPSDAPMTRFRSRI